MRSRGMDLTLGREGLELLNFESLRIDKIMEMRWKKTAAALFLPKSSLSLERANHMELAEKEWVDTETHSKNEATSIDE